MGWNPCPKHPKETYNSDHDGGQGCPKWTEEKLTEEKRRRSLSLKDREIEDLKF